MLRNRVLKNLVLGAAIASLAACVGAQTETKASAPAATTAAAKPVAAAKPAVATTAAKPVVAASPAKLQITDASFGCIRNLKAVRGFWVGNLLGNVDATLAVANSGSGDYPP